MFLAATALVGTGFGLFADDDAVDVVLDLDLDLDRGGGGIKPATGTGESVRDFLPGIGIISYLNSKNPTQ